MLKVRNEIDDPTTEDQAQEIQMRLARELRFGDRFQTVCGTDIAYSKDDKRAYVVAIVLSTNNWRPVAEQRLMLPVKRPYEPGMLGWREAPLMLEVLTRLPLEPDLIVVDGNGTAHPRKFGSACHIGYSLEHPTVGVGKTWPPGCQDIPATHLKRRGNKTALLHHLSGDKIGYQVYTQDNVKPIFVSPGNRVSVDDAANLILRCSPNYRLPEPIRAANEAANHFRHESEK